MWQDPDKAVDAQELVENQTGQSTALGRETPYTSRTINLPEAVQSSATALVFMRTYAK